MTIDLDEVQEEVEVQFDVNLKVALVENSDQAREFRFKSGHEVLIRNNGVQGVCRLQSNYLLITV
jgi:hypothetical protein